MLLPSVSRSQPQTHQKRRATDSQVERARKCTNLAPVNAVATRRLRPGSRIAVAAPSGPFDHVVFDRGLSVLATRYTPVVMPHAHDATRYLAGTSGDRLSDFTRALTDDSLDAVWAARGGFGAAHLLPELRFVLAKKTIIGFSDITALHVMRQGQGVRSLHGPVVTQLATQPVEVVERLFAILEGQHPLTIRGTDSVTPGVAEGPLVGGNLSVIASLVGTPFQPDYNGCVLLLEDIGERPYRLDRLLTQLKYAGILDAVAGVVLGEFTHCEEKDASYSSNQVVSEILAATGKPCARGFAIGHGAVNHAAPLGARVRLDATTAELQWLEGLCD